MTTIHHEVWINAGRDAVFDALTARERLDAWWGKAISAEPRVGHVIEFDHGLGDLLRMRIVDLVPGERLVWKCVTDFLDPGNPASDWLGTRLTFDLRTVRGEDVGQLLAPLVTGEEMTVLDFRHSDWPSDARWSAFCNCAWGVTLESGLKAHCEGTAG
jgi:uncharacterized protein YndB with AHSA1/START domain